MKRVLVVVPPLVNQEPAAEADPLRPDFEAYRLISPIEPATVAADLARRGYEARLFDLGAVPRGRFESLAEALAEWPPDAVVLVQSVLTFATAQDWDGERVFSLAREARPGVVTVLTGGHATNYPGAAVAAGVCDYALRGEPDLAVGDLLDRLRAGQSVAAADERYQVVDVAALPLPDYSSLPAEQRAVYETRLEFGKIRYPGRSPRYRDLMRSRGCVLRCSFCSVAPLRGPSQKRRVKPLDLQLAEIDAALADGVEEIHFFDDLFALGKAELMAFAEALDRRGLRFPWFAAQGFPLWTLDQEALAALAATGMYRVIGAFESGSDRVLQKVVGKVHSTVEHHHRVAEWCAELELELVGMFVVGLPEETRAELLATVEFAYAHPQIDYTVFSIATPMVGTKLMRTVQAQGRLADADSINRVIKRTVALYETDSFAAYEVGVIRTFDWDAVNFATPERRAKYCAMTGLTAEQLDVARAYAQRSFRRFYPDYDGPRSFRELYAQPGLFTEGPRLPGVA